MTNFTCDDKATLIAYIYGELDADARERVDAHLATCAPCADEVWALGDVRAELGLWIPPDAELGFAIVKKSEQATVLRPAQWWTTVPRWAQAAAAVLVLAAGAAVANLQVRSGPEGFSVTTGWMMRSQTLSEPFDGEAIEGRVEQALTSLEQELRSEIRAARTQPGPTAARASAATADEATIRRVQQMLAESEQRQERELALRLTQFSRDLDMQRRADLVRIRSGFGEFGEQMFRQQQMINNVMRVSTTPQQ
jgi:hypothetical protein